MPQPCVVSKAIAEDLQTRHPDSHKSRREGLLA